MKTQWLSRKWQNINQQAKVTMLKYDCSYAYGKLGVSVFSCDTCDPSHSPDPKYNLSYISKLIAVHK